MVNNVWILPGLATRKLNALPSYLMQIVMSLEYLKHVWALLHCYLIIYG